MEGATTGGVDDHVPAAGAVGEVLARVVDEVVCAERTGRGRAWRARDAGDLGAVGLRDLDGEGADAATRADDQDALARLHLRDVADRHEGGDAGDRRCGSLLERQARGLVDERRAGATARSASEPSAMPITSSPGARSVTPSPTDSTTPADVAAAGVAPPQLLEVGHEPGELRHAGHQVPHVGADAGGTDLDAHLAGARDGLGDVAELEHVGGAERVLHDRLHGWFLPHR